MTRPPIIKPKFIYIYIYDLDNCAKEFGFKQDEDWELGVVSDNYKKAIEKTLPYSFGKGIFRNAYRAI